MIVVYFVILRKTGVAREIVVWIYWMNAACCVNQIDSIVPLVSASEHHRHHFDRCHFQLKLMTFFFLAFVVTLEAHSRDQSSCSAGSAMQSSFDLAKVPGAKSNGISTCFTDNEYP